MKDLKYSDDRRVFNVNEPGTPYLSFDMLDKLDCPNLYTTRYINYDSLTGTGEKGLRPAVMKTDDFDEALPVKRATLDILAKQLGSDVEHVAVTNQKHTANVHIVGADDLGKMVQTDEIDGLVTDMENVCLVVYGADCPPIYIADPVKKVVALVHGGRKGTFGKIPAVAINIMKEKWGCDPADIYAAIGPGICMDCYEMGDEIFDELAGLWGTEDAEKLMKRYPAKDSDGEAVPGCKYHLDLRTANLMTLERAGIRPEHIDVSNLCTCCNSDILYSYRAGKMENEQSAMIVNRFGRPAR